MYELKSIVYFQFTLVCKFTDWLAVVYNSHDEIVLIYHKLLCKFVFRSNLSFKCPRIHDTVFFYITKAQTMQVLIENTQFKPKLNVLFRLIIL